MNWPRRWWWETARRGGKEAGGGRQACSLGRAFFRFLPPVLASKGDDAEHQGIYKEESSDWPFLSFALYTALHGPFI